MSIILHIRMYECNYIGNNNKIFNILHFYEINMTNILPLSIGT